MESSEKATQHPLQAKYKLLNMPKAKGGVYGFIRKAQCLETNQIVAIKQIRQAVREDGVEPASIREINALRALKGCPFVVDLLASYTIQEKIYLVFPYVQNNMRQYMVNINKGRMPPNRVKILMKKLLGAVSQAHYSRIIHRDIKPENILILNPQDDSKLQLQLADWGSSRFFNITTKCQNFTQQVIPLAYRAPQILFCTKNYSCSVDMWSVGCLFAELLFGERIFKSTTENFLLFQIVQGLGLVHKQDEQWLGKRYTEQSFEQTTQSLQQYRKDNLRDLFASKYNQQPTPEEDLLKRILRIHPQKRISARQALAHEYFDNHK